MPQIKEMIAQRVVKTLINKRSAHCGDVMTTLYTTELAFASRLIRYVQRHVSFPPTTWIDWLPQMLHSRSVCDFHHQRVVLYCAVAEMYHLLLAFMVLYIYIYIRRLWNIILSIWGDNNLVREEHALSVGGTEFIGDVYFLMHSKSICGIWPTDFLFIWCGVYMATDYFLTRFYAIGMGFELL